MLSKEQTSSTKVPLTMSRKVIYSIVAVACIVIGFIGLVIPIIPGVLFLIGAVILLSQVSDKVKRWSEQQPWMGEVRVRMIQMNGLRPMARARFALLLAARSIVTAAHCGARVIERWLPKRA